MDQIICPKCGRKSPAGTKFCSDCGAPLASASGKPQAQPAKSGRNLVRDIAVIAGVLIVVAIAYFLFRTPSNTPVTTPTATSETPAKDQSLPQGHPPIMDMNGKPMTAGFLDSLPKDYNSLVSLGNNNMDHSNFAVAAECYRRALAIDGSSADVRTDYGACLHNIGLPDRAIEEFRKAIAQAPTHAIARFNLGIVYKSLNQMDSAKVYWKKYLELDPNGPASAAAKQYLKENGG